MEDARDATVWAEDFGRTLESQLELYTRLDALSRRQRDLIEDDDATPLLEVLGERQGLVDRIVAGNTHLTGLRRVRDAYADALSPAQRDDLDRRLADLVALAGAIAVRDDQDRRTMESRRDRIAGELSTMTRRRGAAAAYAGPAAAPSAAPRFQDQEV